MGFDIKEIVSADPKASALQFIRGNNFESCHHFNLIEDSYSSKRVCDGSISMCMSEQLLRATCRT